MLHRPAAEPQQSLRSGSEFEASSLNRRPHTLPLAGFLVDMLERRRKSAVGDYVFESERGRLHNPRYALAEVERVSGVSFCVHDLRRTFATAADGLDIPAYALKALLNHANMADVTAGYVVHDVERLRKPIEKIADYLLKAGGLRKGATVTEIQTGARHSQPVANKLQ